MSDLELIRLLYVVTIVWVMWVLRECRLGATTWVAGQSQTTPTEQPCANALEIVAAPSQAKRKRERRGPKTRTAEDCPNCCAEAECESGPVASSAHSVVPYSQLKSKRGRPKLSLTEGYACHNRECEYCGNTDSQVHALVADGDKLTQQGLVKQIKCQGCGSKFLVTRNTAMYGSKLTVERVGEINRGLAEGLSISACARVFGHSRSTIHRIARVSGDHSNRCTSCCYRAFKPCMSKWMNCGPN